MKISLRRAEKQCRQAAGRATEITKADPAQDARSAPAPAPANWVQAQLRDRIQRTGAALALDTQTAHRQMRDPTSFADREPER